MFFMNKTGDNANQQLLVDAIVLSEEEEEREHEEDTISNDSWFSSFENKNEFTFDSELESPY